MKNILRPLPALLLAIASTALSGATPAQAPLLDTIAQAVRDDPAWASPLRGNVTLPETAAALPALAGRLDLTSARITWRSSDPKTITDTDRGRGADVIRKGAVIRGKADRPVRLTATVSLAGHAPRAVPM